MLRTMLQQSGGLRGLLGQAATHAERVLSSAAAGCSTSGRLAAASAPEAAGQALSARFKSSSTSSGLKVYKPTTPGFRGRVITSRVNLWRGGPFKPLTEGFAKTGGRNNRGVITSRHIGGGHRKVYRLIDWWRAEGTAPGIVERVEYDPNRSARIALVRHETAAGAGGGATTAGAPNSAAMHRSGCSYILAPQGVEAGDAVRAGPGSPIRPGCALPLSDIPVGTAVHNVELRPGKGGQLARAAGTSCTLVKKGDDGYAVLRLPSGEQRLVLSRCVATVGVLSNPQHKNRKLGKAGASRWSGRRPSVRGVAMNPVDHPHGGGEGKSKGGISRTPWGKPTKGYRTRHSPRTDWAIRLSRHKAKRSTRG